MGKFTWSFRFTSGEDIKSPKLVVTPVFWSLDRSNRNSTIKQWASTCENVNKFTGVNFSMNNKSYTYPLTCLKAQNYYCSGQTYGKVHNVRRSRHFLLIIDKFFAENRRGVDQETKQTPRTCEITLKPSFWRVPDLFVGLHQPAQQVALVIWVCITPGARNSYPGGSCSGRTPSR